jgi:DNA-directed RNA polymerase specialized sigma subunit
LALYYIQGLTLVEIGKALGVTGGRVCQLLGRALSELQGDLGGVLAA